MAASSERAPCCNDHSMSSWRKSVFAADAKRHENEMRAKTLRVTPIRRPSWEDYSLELL